MTENEKHLMVHIDGGPEVDEEELERLTRHLREELIELDVKAVNLVRKGKTPETAKACDPIAWGQLLLTITASGGVLVALIKTLQSWLMIQNVNIEMDINGKKIKMRYGKVSKDEEKRLIDTYIAAVAGKSVK